MQKFNSISELLKLSANTQLYLMLNNGYAVRVSKTDIKATAKSIAKHGIFSGSIVSQNDLHTHIEIN